MVLALTGCASMKPQDFAGNEPRLVLEEYFNGRSKAWGIFQDRFGTLRRQFVVDIHGTWDGETLTLVEDFVYSDGETEQRVWELTKTGPNNYTGTAAGVVGVATGETSGNAFHWTYSFDLPVDGSTWRVNFDDWMWLQDENNLFNRATIRKWGIELGTVSIFFQRIDESADVEGEARAAANDLGPQSVAAQ